MPTPSGIRWFCPSRDCNWSIVSTVNSASGSAPRCICGQPMKQVDVVPVMSYLEFLRGVLDLDVSGPDEE